MATLEVSFSDASALLAFVDAQIAKGMVFLPDAGGVEPLTSCDLVVAMNGRSHTLRADIVYVREDGAGKGVGLQLTPPDAATLAALRALAEPAPPEAFELPMPELPMPELPSPEAAALEKPSAEAEEGSEDPEDAGDDDEDEHGVRAPQLHERMRSLTSAEQQRLASTGTLQERTMLERLYGPNVWEALLTSGRLTPPEVARIAKKGTVPRTLLEVIGSNGGWLASTLVQRALLSNPRCPTTVITRVLQSMPRRDLQLVPQQTAYPAQVRQAAKAMLGR